MFVCSTCTDFVSRFSGNAVPASANDNDQTKHPSTQTHRRCWICLGVCQSSLLTADISAALETSAKPYLDPYLLHSNVNNDSNNGLHYDYAINRFSQRVHPPTVSLPGDLLLRMAAAVAEASTKSTHQNDEKEASDMTATTQQHVLTPAQAEEWTRHLKQQASTILQTCIRQLEGSQPAPQSSTATSTTTNSPSTHLPTCLQDEEGGYLAVHAMLVPHLRPHQSSITNKSLTRAGRRAHHHPMDGPQQGGDPRTNLEQRVFFAAATMGNNTNEDPTNDNTTNSNNMPKPPSSLWTINQALQQWTTAAAQQQTFYQSTIIQPWKEWWSKLLQQQQQDDSTAADGRNDHITTSTNDHDDHDDHDHDSSSSSSAIHVAVWRRPFYLASHYTKIRRDVSQTPFFVTEQGKRQRLGISSVEEEILPVLERFCGGISNLNNTLVVSSSANTTLSSQQNNNNKQSTSGKDARRPSLASSGIVFGMAKFHASGREDMDVHMIVGKTGLSPANDSSSNSKKPTMTGRPFVCEIIDAFAIPSIAALPRMVAEINHEDGASTTTTTNPPPSPITTTSITDATWYGRNPHGVGIHENLHFVPSSAFGQLQAQTEHKVKHYGCLCWTPKIWSLQELQAKLTWNVDDAKKIRQRTPLRVLHRRSNLVRVRHVRTCRVAEQQTDDPQYFVLHLSTDAGTCK